MNKKKRTEKKATSFRVFRIVLNKFLNSFHFLANLNILSILNARKALNVLLEVVYNPYSKPTSTEFKSTIKQSKML